MIEFEITTKHQKCRVLFESAVKIKNEGGFLEKTFDRLQKYYLCYTITTKTQSS
jgi:hypothetical protein